MGDTSQDIGADDPLTEAHWQSLVEPVIDVAAKLILFILSSWVASVAFNYLTLTDMFIAWEDAIIIGFLLRWVAIRLRIGA